VTGSGISAPPAPTYLSIGCGKRAEKKRARKNGKLANKIILEETMEKEFNLEKEVADLQASISRFMIFVKAPGGVQKIIAELKKNPRLLMGSSMAEYLSLMCQDSATFLEFMRELNKEKNKKLLSDLQNGRFRFTG
jgi:hypothetical protein